MKHSNSLLKLNTLAIELNKYIRCSNEGFIAQKTTEFTDALQIVISEETLEKDQHINNLLNVMLDAQQRRDNLFFADILSYELIPYLKQVIHQN